MVPILEQDDILLLVIVLFIRNIILLGLSTKKRYSDGSHMQKLIFLPHVGEA